MNSPCAMLMTPIWPNIEPISVVGKARAANGFARRGCYRRGLKRPRRKSVLESERAKAVSLIALGEGIRLDEVGGFVNQFVLAIELGLADARLRPQVMIFVNADVAFRRTLELDAWRGGRNLVDVEASSLLRR